MRGSPRFQQILPTVGLFGGYGSSNSVTAGDKSLSVLLNSWGPLAEFVGPLTMESWSKGTSRSASRLPLHSSLSSRMLPQTGVTISISGAPARGEVGASMDEASGPQYAGPDLLHPRLHQVIESFQNLPELSHLLDHISCCTMLQLAFTRDLRIGLCD